MNQLKNTQQDLKMYYSNDLVRKTLHWAIAEHIYGINLLA